MDFVLLIHCLYRCPNPRVRTKLMKLPPLPLLQSVHVPSKPSHSTANYSIQRRFRPKEAEITIRAVESYSAPFIEYSGDQGE